MYVRLVLYTYSAAMRPCYRCVPPPFESRVTLYAPRHSFRVAFVFVFVRETHPHVEAAASAVGTAEHERDEETAARRFARVDGNGLEPLALVEPYRGVAVHHAQGELRAVLRLGMSPRPSQQLRPHAASSRRRGDREPLDVALARFVACICVSSGERGWPCVAVAITPTTSPVSSRTATAVPRIVSG